MYAAPTRVLFVCHSCCASVRKRSRLAARGSKSSSRRRPSNTRSHLYLRCIVYTAFCRHRTMSSPAFTVLDTPALLLEVEGDDALLAVPPPMAVPVPPTSVVLVLEALVPAQAKRNGKVVVVAAAAAAPIDRCCCVHEVPPLACATGGRVLLACPRLAIIYPRTPSPCHALSLSPVHLLFTTTPPLCLGAVITFRSLPFVFKHALGLLVPTTAVSKAYVWLLPPFIVWRTLLAPRISDGQSVVGAFRV